MTIQSMEHQTTAMLNRQLEHGGSLPLVDGPSLDGHEIKHNDEAYTIIIDNTLILCGSRMEYQTLLRLLQEPMECVPFRDLMPSFNYQRDREALGKRIQKVRRKLPPYLTIRCEIGEGYILREKLLEHPA